MKDKLRSHLVEIIIVAVVLSVAITMAIVVSLSKVSSSLAIIKHHNEIVLKVDLGKEGEERHIEVAGDYGPVTIGIKKDAICIEESSCPSQYCVHEGWVKAGGKPIICAYNGISIYFSEDDGASAILG